MNFKNFGNGDVDGGEGRHTPGTYPLTRQGSIYSLTFDELQSTLGSVGKDFGSMNMDELLKSIWSAEETQTMQIAGSSTAAGPQMNLNRQGSLTLPRTMSQRTVDEVWRDMSKEDNVGNLNLGSSFNQRQATLGEMTLEDFLVKAGVVREDIPLIGNPDTGGYFGDFSQSSSNNGLGIGFQQAGQNMGLMGDRMDNNNLPLNFNGARSSQQPLPSFSMQTGVPYATTIPLPAIAKIGSPKIRDGIVGYSDPGLNGNLSSDGIGKINGDTSSVSPVPFAFNGVIRGRKHGAVEKVVERRQRRMIKNRESAARSRARKQAYTTELEAEVAKLKEENEELRKKQAEIVELQKKQELEMKDMQQGGGKRRCLRRTQTS